MISRPPTDRFNRRQNQQLDFMALGLAPHFFHHWQFAVSSGADHKSVAFPRYVLLDRQGRVSEVVPEFFRWPFLAFADLPMVDHDVVFVGAAVDLEGTEGEFLEAHTCLAGKYVTRSFW